MVVEHILEAIGSHFCTSKGDLDEKSIQYKRNQSQEIETYRFPDDTILSARSRYTLSECNVWPFQFYSDIS